ncbi:MAG TPA: LamG domain-containing protein [bacterium]|jgi:hypothetical protein|nr:LamG domain-containing protein [bacterium]
MKIVVLRAFSFFALAVFADASTVLAADTNPSPRLTVELRDGSRVVGTSVEKDLKFHSALLGDLKLAVKDIRLMDCVKTNFAKLTSAGGDELMVSLLDSPLIVKTGFGRVELVAESIRKITVTVARTASAHPTGLVALWSGENDGNDSIGHNNLELTEVSFADGQVGRAFMMNGFGSCMRLSDRVVFNPGDGDGLTISAWIKPSDVAGFHPILEWNPSDKLPGVIGVQFWIGNVPGSQGVLAAHFVGTDRQPHSIISPPGTVVAGRFQHVAATYDKATGGGMLYLNGMVVARALWNKFTPLTTGDFWISRRPTDHPGDWTYNTFFSGLLDEISIYNRALSAEEIADLVTEENHGEPLSPNRTGSLMPRNGISRDGFNE